MNKITLLVGLSLAASLASAQDTPVSWYYFRTDDGGVQQHLFITPGNGRITLGAFGVNHPNATFEFDYSFGKSFKLGKLAIAPSFSTEYARNPQDAGLYAFTSAQEGNLYLAFPAYYRFSFQTHQPVFLVPSGRLGYKLDRHFSIGSEWKLKYGTGSDTALLGGFIEGKQGKTWIRVSYLGKVTGGRNEFRLVLGTSF